MRPYKKISTQRRARLRSHTPGSVRGDGVRRYRRVPCLSGLQPSEHIDGRRRRVESVGRKKANLMTDLRYQMAQTLGYDIDKVTIQNNA